MAKNIPRKPPVTYSPTVRIVDKDKEYPLHVRALVEYLAKHTPTTITVDRNVFMWLVDRARIDHET